MINRIRLGTTIQRMEQLENALFDDDDGVDMPPPSTTMAPLTRTPFASVGSSHLVQCPSTSTQLPPTSTPLPPFGGSQGNCSGTRRKEK